MTTTTSGPPAQKRDQGRRRNRVIAALLAAAFVIAAVVVVTIELSGSTDTGRGGDAPRPAAIDQPVADPAPATTFVNFDGSTGSLSDYRGRPVVVNFWASWCPSCVAEMSAAFRPVQSRLGADVAFLGMNLQDDRTSALRLVSETGVLFDLAEDTSGDLYLELGGIGMPFTVFIDANGGIVERHNGPLSEAQLEAMIIERFSL